jgi:Flp pilus assembly protein protease CpaA
MCKYSDMTSRQMPTRIAVVGARLFAVACCAGIPAIAAALGGVAGGAVIGLAAGAITAVVLGTVALLLVRGRRRRARQDGRR